MAGTYTWNGSYGWDGSLSGEAYPAAGGLGNEAVNYVLDDWGRPLSSSGTHNGTVELAAAVSYTRYGEMQRLELGEGTKRAWLSHYFEDNTRRLARTVVDAEVPNPMLADINYSYDPAGNVTSIADRPMGQAADTQCFRYDHLRRLTEAWTTNGCEAQPATAALGGPAPYWQSFTHDAERMRVLMRPLVDLDRNTRREAVMTEFSQDEAIRALMRRVFDQEVADSQFDVEGGLRDVLDRVAASTQATTPRSAKVPVAVGATSMPAEAPPTEEPGPRSWANLIGRDRHAACILAAQGGDTAAFDALIADLSPLVWHVARGSGLDRVLTEDVVQTVWLALLRHLPRLTEPRALADWLITMTRREANRVRHQARHIALSPELAERTATVEPSAEHEVLRTERDRTLWSAFHKLSQRCQELLRLTCSPAGQSIEPSPRHSICRAAASGRPGDAA